MKKEPRSLGFRGTPLLFCLLLLSLLCTVHYGSNVVHLDSWKHELTKGGPDLMRRLLRGKDLTQLEATGFACHSDVHTDVCVANRPVRIDMRTMQIYAPFGPGMPRANRTVQPYARKEDQTAMDYVSPVHILQGNRTPPACEYTHNVPAVVFSSGGFTGNIFHDFNEVLIPLFITCRHFQSRLIPVVTDFRPKFIRRYHPILSRMSDVQVINPAANGSVHCFPGAVVGLHYHDNLALNVSGIPGGYSILDFRQFIRESYNIQITTVPKSGRPVLILLSRPKSRMFLNEKEMVGMMEELGFRVIVARPTMMSNLDEFIKVLSSCSVVVGVHGAGMTNELFMPPGAVLVQVVAVGLDWASATYYGGPATEMGLQYVPYKIEPEESSLFRLYGRDHPVIKTPEVISAKGYRFSRGIYLDGQNLNINLVRFRETLVKALGLLGRAAPSA